MRITESELRRVIREELIKESFLSNITNPKKWKQFGNAMSNSAKRFGVSSGVLGEGFDYDGYLRYVFVESDHVDELQRVISRFLNHSLSENEMLRQINKIGIDALCEYMGVTVQSIARNKMAKKHFNELVEISSRQLASSEKYFRSGGIEKVLSMKKRDLEMQFNRIAPIVVKMCNV